MLHEVAERADFLKRNDLYWLMKGVGEGGGGGTVSYDLRIMDI